MIALLINLFIDLGIRIFKHLTNAPSRVLMDEASLKALKEWDEAG